MTYSEHKQRLRWLNDAESEGRVADSLETRMALIDLVNCGAITHEYALSELNKIKRSAKKNGLITRAQALNGF